MSFEPPEKDVASSLYIIPTSTNSTVEYRLWKVCTRVTCHLHTVHYNLLTFKHFSLHLGPSEGAVALMSLAGTLGFSRPAYALDPLETCLLHSLVIAVGLHRSSYCSGAADHRTCQMRGSMTLSGVIFC